MVVDSTSTLCRTVVGKLNDELGSFLNLLPENVTSDVESLKSLQECFTHTENMFNGFQTEYQRQVHLAKSGLVMPMSVKIGRRNDTKPDGSQCSVPVFVQYVPITLTIQDYLNIQPSKARQHSERLVNYEDTETYKNCDYFQVHPSAFKIVLYDDDIEVGNPLGSRAGVHKLTMFYYTIHGYTTGKLNCINLLLVCHASDLKSFGYKVVLDPLLRDLKELDAGIQDLQNRTPHLIKARLTHVVGDNLAANQILGLVCSFTNTHYCRFCYISGREANFTVSSHGQLCRSATSHQLDVEFLSFSSDFYKSTGVKEACVLDTLDYFSSMDATVPDIM